MKYEELTPEQRKQFHKVFGKFTLRAAWNGAHHGAMLGVMDFILVLGTHIYLNDNMFVMFGSTLVAFFFVFNRYSRNASEIMKKFQEDVELISKK